MSSFKLSTPGNNPREVARYVPLQYWQKIINLFGSSLISYWPLWEPSGTLVSDIGNHSQDLIVNGGFETAGVGAPDVFGTWVETAGDGAIADEGTLVHGGSHAAKLTAGATANTKVAQTITVVPGVTYNLPIWTRGDGTNGGRYGVYNVTGSADIIAATATGVTGTTYTQITVPFTAPAGCVSIRVDLWCPTANGGIAYFDDVQLISPFHGIYGASTAAPTLGQAGIGDNRFCASFDGGDYANIYSAALAAAFNNQELTLMAYAKVSGIADWTDSTLRTIVGIRADASNRVLLWKNTVNNLMVCQYDAGGTSKTASATVSTLGWFHMAMVISKSGNYLRNYINGVQQGVDVAGLGVWAALPLSAAACTIGSRDTSSTSPWKGTIAHVVVINRAATPAEVYLCHI